jgi:hypothetical protein
MGGGSDTQNTVRYAPYLESAHGKFLGTGLVSTNFISVFNTTLDQSPYANYETQDIDEGFFGMRTDDPSLTYEIKNFPSLWDMFGKFMAGLDLHDLWGQIYQDVIQGAEINDAISAHSASLQDEIDTNVMPRFLSGMRDINSVQSTTFVIGKALIQDSHVKAVNEFSTKLRMHAMDVAQQQWGLHLEWNKSVITVFSEMMKLYYSARMDMDRNQLEYEVKDAMWNINLFENARAILGAMAGSAASASPNEPSAAQKAVGGALSGAAAGAMVGGPIGAGIGAAIMGIASIFT